jgi:hypothetical protein
MYLRWNIHHEHLATNPWYNYDDIQSFINDFKGVSLYNIFIRSLLITKHKQINEPLYPVGLYKRFEDGNFMPYSQYVHVKQHLDYVVKILYEYRKVEILDEVVCQHIRYEINHAAMHLKEIHLFTRDFFESNTNLTWIETDQKACTSTGI